METFFNAIAYIVGFTVIIYIAYVSIKLKTEIKKAIVKKAINENEFETYKNEYNEFLQWQQSQERK